VVSIHDLAWAQVPDTLRRSTRLLDRSLMARSVARAQRIIAVSHATAADVAAHWPSARPHTQVIHGAAEELPAPSPLANGAPTLAPQGYLLFVGTPEPRKNLPRLLEAYAQAHRAQADFPPLVIAGGHGWGGQDLKAQLHRLQLSQRVHLLGPVSDSQLAHLYNNALCLVMPSLYEGFGLPIVEALQHGLPVITANNSSMPEVAGPAGLLVNPLEPSTITHALQRMVNDPSLRTQLATAARTQASHFSWDQAAQATLTVLRDAAAVKSGLGK
jgi:glycosyltransferase involved in cell wall biosynthesis